MGHTHKGAGAHVDWQVTGTVDYAPNPWLNLHLGYRSLNFNYQASDRNLGFDAHTRGRSLPAPSVSDASSGATVRAKASADVAAFLRRAATAAIALTLFYIPS